MGTKAQEQYRHPYTIMIAPTIYGDPLATDREDWKGAKRYIREDLVQGTTTLALLNAALAEYELMRDAPSVERGAREAVRGMMVRLGIYDQFVQRQASGAYSEAGE